MKKENKVYQQIIMYHKNISFSKLYLVIINSLTIVIMKLINCERHVFIQSVSRNYGDVK